MRNRDLAVLPAMALINIASLYLTGWPTTTLDWIGVLARIGAAIYLLTMLVRIVRLRRM